MVIEMAMTTTLRFFERMGMIIRKQKMMMMMMMVMMVMMIMVMVMMMIKIIIIIIQMTSESSVIRKLCNN